jgi:hypothetical protein
MTETTPEPATAAPVYERLGERLKDHAATILPDLVLTVAADDHSLKKARE